MSSELGKRAAILSIFETRKGFLRKNIVAVLISRIFFSEN